MGRGGIEQKRKRKGRIGREDGRGREDEEEEDWNERRGDRLR